MAGHTATYSKLYPFIAPALVNGAAGAAVTPHGQLYSVMAFTVTDAKITHIDALAGPGRLAQLDLTFPDTHHRPSTSRHASRQHSENTGGRAEQVPPDKPRPADHHRVVLRHEAGLKPAHGRI